MDLSIFHARLRELIESRGTTIRTVAAETQLSVPTVNRYVNEKRTPDIKSIIKIAEYFGVSLDWLVGVETDRYSVIPSEQQNLLRLYSLASPDDRRVIHAVLSKYQNKE